MREIASLVFGVKEMSELDNAYKKAVIKFVNVQCPRLIEAMERLARNINNMPRTLRVRP